MTVNEAFECPVQGCEVQIPALSEAVQLLFLQRLNSTMWSWSGRDGGSLI